MAGSLHNGVCYPTLAQAQTEFCSTWAAGFSTSTEATQLRCGATGETAFTIDHFVNGQKQAQTTQGTYPAFPPCDYSGGADFASDWAAVAFVLLVIVWAGKSLIKLFDYHHERD